MRTSLNKALAATKESRHIEFKGSFDPNSDRDWLQNIVRAIVAMANSGGGFIIFGVDSSGKPTGSDVNPILRLDPADITNKIYKFTGVQFAGFEIIRRQKETNDIAVIVVDSVETPIVFTKPGMYSTGPNNQDRAFNSHAIYFRHGAKSEPDTNDDLRQFIDRRLDNIRKAWMTGVQQVVEAPLGSQVNILPPDIRPSTSADATPVRFVDDLAAPAYHLVDPNQTHPFRQKDVIEIANRQLGSGNTISSYTMLVIRRAYGIDHRPEYFYRPISGSPQYSQGFIDWLIIQFEQDKDFLKTSKAKLMQGA
jgi:hypothetical protein